MAMCRPRSLALTATQFTAKERLRHKKSAVAVNQKAPNGRERAFQPLIWWEGTMTSFDTYSLLTAATVLAVMATAFI
ncbi:MAG: hypothetical protein DBW90_01175 [Halieaceae bacterium]|nr:MAG: hypothetical protein DBW90_01175 [Halieaceae bacterium]